MASEVERLRRQPRPYGERQVPFQPESPHVFSTSYGRDGQPIRRPNFDFGLKLPRPSGVRGGGHE